MAGTASLLALRIPELMAVEYSIRKLVSYGLLLIVGLMVGSFRRQGAWRWALASLVAFGLGDYFHLSSGPHLPNLDPRDMWSHVVTGGPDWAIHAVPVLVGAYLAAFLSGDKA